MRWEGRERKDRGERGREGETGRRVRPSTEGIEGPEVSIWVSGVSRVSTGSAKSVVGVSEWRPSRMADQTHTKFAEFCGFGQRKDRRHFSHPNLYRLLSFQLRFSQ